MILASLTDACGDTPGAICEWVYERTDGNETVAELADWFVDRPLQVVLILVVAWVLSRLARRWISRVVHRVVNPDRELAAERLRRIGVRPPSMLTGEITDPRRETRAHAISGLVGSTASAAIWAIAVMMAVGRLGVDLGPLIAGAGIAGIALGFGAQSLVKDWISGLFMTLEDQYGVGDVVDVGEASGVVERITLRATVLRGVDGTVWHVPNGQIVRVGNRSQLWSVALLDVTIAYDTDVGRAQTLLHDAATELCERDEFAPTVLEAPEVLGVESLGADGVTLRLTVKVMPGSQWSLQRALREAVKTVFDANGVTMPYLPRAVLTQFPSTFASTGDDDTPGPPAG
ncbi:MAG: mechanosensitive ion channel family protein [Ilumatobacteraceae bacterium]